MTTRKNEEGAVPSRAGRVALLLWAMFIAGACVEVQTRPSTSATAQAVTVVPVSEANHIFTISYNDAGCPVAAAVTPRTAAGLTDYCRRSDCVTVKVTQGQPPPTIGFQQADGGSIPKGDLEIYFDPFTPPTLKGKSGAIRIQADIGYRGRATFKFSVGAADCPPLDPEIIVER